MIKAKHILGGAAALLAAGAVLAAGADLGQAQKQATNWTAIVMFAIFVGITLWITKWAAATTKTAVWSEKNGASTVLRSPSAAADSNSARSDSIRTSTTWESGSPKRTLYSTSLGPSEVSISPA